MILPVLFLLFSPPPASDTLASVSKLYEEKRYEEAVRLARQAQDGSAALDYYLGMSLARLQRWEEARKALLAGRAKAPRDKRFPIELAGVAYLRKDFTAARKNLKQALEIDPTDAYANDFLATLFFLEGNLDAALQYWNRAGKPRIEQIRMSPEPALDPVLLDRAFAAAPASILRLDQLLDTRAFVENLSAFARARFELTSSGADGYDLVFHSVAKSSSAATTVPGLVRLLRGVPYQTVYPEFYNLRGSAANLTSLFRWDAQKRRAFLSLSAPLKRNPRWRFGIYFDGRNENWDVARALPGYQFNLRKAEAGAGFQSVLNSAWSWKTGLSVSDRRFRNSPAGSPLFPDGWLLKYNAGLEHRLLYLPERRLEARSSASVQFGRMFTPAAERFTRLEASLKGRWFPMPRGEDYEVRARLRYGKAFGDLPFDELSMLGLERDNGLWMRAHVGTAGGKKGSTPLGSGYILSNWEMNKIVYQNGFLSLKLGPFLDTGKTYGTSARLGSRKLLWDTGVQLKAQILGGVSFTFFYGKDLRSGNNSFYATSTPD